MVANIDGEYDKTGLPTPLTLTFYFSIGGDRIEQLIILRNKTSQRPELVLSDPIQAYLIAKNNSDVHGMLACFAEGAVVVDEGHGTMRPFGDPRMDRRVHCAISGESGRDQRS